LIVSQVALLVAVQVQPAVVVTVAESFAPVAGGVALFGDTL